MHLVVDSFGHIMCIYNEQIDLAALGTLSIRRASHVEPDASGHWWVDLNPAGGPRLGPFVQRRDAIDAELAWLDRHLARLPTKL